MLRWDCGESRETCDLFEESKHCSFWNLTLIFRIKHQIQLLKFLSWQNLLLKKIPYSVLYEIFGSLSPQYAVFSVLSPNLLIKTLKYLLFIAVWIFGNFPSWLYDCSGPSNSGCSHFVHYTCLLRHSDWCSTLLYTVSLARALNLACLCWSITF